jgi:hypothetical protein
MYSKTYIITAIFGLMGFIPLSLSAATATLNIPMSTQQTIQQEVAAGQSGIQMNIAAAEAERAQQAQASTGTQQVPGNAKPPARAPVAPPVKAAPPPKPDVTDSTQAAEANSNVTLENQSDENSNDYPPTPTGFISSGGNSGGNDNVTWDYGF